MKRILSLVLVLVMAFSLFACTKSEIKAPEKVTLEHVYLSKKIPLPEDVHLYSVMISGDNVYLRGTKSVEWTDEYGVEHYDDYDTIYLSDKNFSEYKEIYTFKNEYSYDEVTFASTSKFLNTVSSDSHGGLWLGIASYHNYQDKDTSEWINENDITFYHLESNGDVREGFNVAEILKTVDGIEQHEIDNAYVQSVLENGDGKTYIAMEKRIIAIDENKKVLNSVSFDNYAYEYAMTKNGNIRFPIWDWSGEQGKVEVKEYDTKTYEVTTLTTLSTTDNVFFSADGELYTDDWYKVSKVDVKTGKTKPIFDYLNSDINVDRFQRSVIINDEFYAFEYDKNYENRSLLHLTPATDGEAVEKYVITLATTDISSNLRDMIIDYNRSSQDYRISVKAYGWEESSVEAFDLDLVSGKIPDIVCLDSLDASKYASKGIFADLGKMMDEDDKFTRDVFLDNIIEATKIKGTIYSMPVSFNIRTVAGKERIVGKSWTWQDALNILKNNPGSKLIDEVDRETFMTNYFPLFLEEFIDYDTGKSSFSSPEFKAFLEFAKTIPAEINWEDYYADIDWEEYDARFKNDKTFLQHVYLSSPTPQTYLRETFGEDISIIGYPSKDGNGHSIVFDTEFAISNKSPYKEQAWDFLKMVFEEDYQLNYVWSFPVTKSAFEKAKQQEIEYVKGENVDYGIADDDIFIQPETMSLIKPVFPEAVDSDQIEYALESIETVANIALTATKVARLNDPVIEIIKGEAAAFFDSKKGIDETCKIIESRVNLYLAENM